MKVAQITIEETLGMTVNVEIPDNMTEDEVRDYVNSHYRKPYIEFNGLSNDSYESYTYVDVEELKENNKLIFEPEEDWETFKTRL